MVNFLKKKKGLRKLNSPRSFPDPKSYQCGHQQPFNLVLVFNDFRDTSGSLRKIFSDGLKAEKTAVTREIFWQLSQREKFQSKKNPYFVIYKKSGNYVSDLRIIGHGNFVFFLLNKIFFLMFFIFFYYYFYWQQWVTIHLFTAVKFLKKYFLN